MDTIGIVLSEGTQRRTHSVTLDQKGDQHHKSPRGPWSLQSACVHGQDCLHARTPHMDTSGGQLVPGLVAGDAEQALTTRGEIPAAADCPFPLVLGWLT